MWCTVVRSVNSSARKPKYEPQTCHLLAEWLWPGYRTSLYLVYKVNVVSFMCGDYGKWSLDSYFILTSSSCPIPVSPAILDRTPWGKTTASENQQENKSLLARHCPMSAGLLQQSPNWSPLFPLSSLSTQQTARCCVCFFFQQHNLLKKSDHVEPHLNLSKASPALTAKPKTFTLASSLLLWPQLLPLSC